MRTFITEHTVYTFDELSEEAQQYAIERQREFTYETLNDWLEDEMDYQLIALLKQHKIKPVDVTARYSLGYSQGDGASFTGDIEWGVYRATIDTNHWGTHYSHSKTVDVKELNSIKTDKDAPDAKWAELQSIVEKIGDELTTLGYNAIELATRDEALIEDIKANEYEFYSDGKIA